jgi:hypothetical protein
MIGAEFSNDDFEALSEWLMRRGKGIFDVVELEGFLTAIVIAPNRLSPLAWLPKVWGGKHPDFTRQPGVSVNSPPGSWRPSGRAPNERELESIDVADCGFVVRGVAPERGSQHP